MTTKRIDTDNVTYQDLLDNPALLEQLERQARAERAAVVHQVFIAPLKRVLTDDRGTAGVGAPAHG